MQEFCGFQNKRPFWALLFTSLILAPGVYADEDSSSTPTSNTQISEKTVKKSTLDLVREKAHVSYWSMFIGPGLNSQSDQSMNGKGQPIATGSFHILWTGYRINSNHSLGIFHRYSQDFSSTALDGSKVSAARSYRDPRLYWRAGNIVNNKVLNYTHEGRLEIPTTQRAERAGRVTVAQSVHIVNFKPKNSKWAPGIFGAASAFFNRSEESFVSLAVGPYVSYIFNPKWSIYAWTWFDADQNFSRPFGSLNGMGPGSDSDYFRIGPMYSPVPNFQIYPCIQSFLVNPRLNTTTIGLELSAQL